MESLYVSRGILIVKVLKKELLDFSRKICCITNEPLRPLNPIAPPAYYPLFITRILNTNVKEEGKITARVEESKRR